MYNKANSLPSFTVYMYLCVVNEALDHDQRLSFAPVPPHEPLGLSGVDQYILAETLMQTCTNTHGLIQNAFLREHRDLLYVSFIIKEMPHYRPPSLFSLFMLCIFD